jgi:hypothetical protein
VADSDDPLLSIWRISWIAHILPADAQNLFNGNIFHPEPRTLAYSDSVLLQGLAAAPLIWAGLSPVAAYNLALLGSIALSGAAMWLYAYRLTGSGTAAVLAGIVFAFVPFRFDHLPHLELQATMFLPLTLWWLDRALDSGHRRDVYGTVASLVAQVYCGIYYAVFLVSALLLVLPLRLTFLPAERRQALLRPALMALGVAVLLVVPYLSVYALNREALGDRSPRDVQMYSATMSNYLSTPAGNLVHGIWSEPLGRTERRLFPGVLAAALAIVGLVGLDRRRVTLIVVGLTGFVVSLGSNTPIYEVLRTVVFPYRGLLAPARAAILVYLALGGLVAFGWARLESRVKRWTPVATAALACLLLFEYATRIDSWLTLPEEPPAVYRWLAQQPRSVVVEFPISTADRLDAILDGLYMFRSTYHWQPILNGYSGFFPKSFLDLTEHVKTFPDDGAMAYLKTRGVDLIVVHGNYMQPNRFGTLTTALLGRKDIQMLAQFEETHGPDVVFRLLR